jgi:hypothetical protein
LSAKIPRKSEKKNADYAKTQWHIVHSVAEMLHSKIMVLFAKRHNNDEEKKKPCKRTAIKYRT